MDLQDLQELKLRELRKLEASRKGIHPARATRWLDVWGLCLPHRVATEDLGGYIEEINELAENGESAWKFYLRMLAAIFWTGCNALRDLPHELWTSKPRESQK